MIPGIDVSHWQGEIDWAKVAQSGVKFAFIKATEFPDRRISVFIDQNLKKNILGAQKYNIPWGAYHFFRTHIDPVIQAQVLCETVGEFFSMPPVIDLEVAGCKGTQLIGKVQAFVNEVQRITSRKPIIYTSGGFWRSYMLYNRRAETDWALGYPLWLAQYTSNWPTVPYPWLAWDFWQYSSSGRLPGIPGAVDMNWYIGSQEELVNRFVNEQRVKTDPLQPIAKKSEQPLEVVDSPFEHEKKNELNSDPFAGEEPDGEWIKRYFFGK